MPITYTTPVNPYVGNIGELMEHAGTIEAQRAREVANANAAATVAGGNAWGGAVRDIGATVGGQLMKVGERMADPAYQADKLKLEGMQRASAATKVLSAAMQDTPKLAEDGVSVWDVPAITKRLADQGYGPEAGAAAQHLDGINTAFRQAQAARMAVVQKGAQAVGAAGNDPTLANHFLDLMEQNQLLPADSLKQYREFIAADPGNVAKLTAYLSGPQKPVVLKPGEQGFTEAGAPIPGMSVPDEPGKGDYTINGQRFNAKGQKIGEPVPKEAEPPKAGSPEDFVSRARRLAISANGGKPLSDAQQQAVDVKALGEFKEANADPEVRAAALAQKDIAAQLARMQMGQMPTAEDAASIADDLVHHRIAPEQLVSLFSTRGKEGLAFKLQVTKAAKQQDPTFNFEEASSEYNLVKSPGFQNTVRYMDSVQESMPRLMQTATKLGNGQFRTWNDVVNATKNQFNDVDLKRFKTDALLVGDEVAKILSGGGSGSATSDAKLKQATELIGQSDSVPAIAGALDEINTLIGFRRKAMTRGTYMEGTSAVKPPSTAPTEGTEGVVNGRAAIWKTVNGKAGWYAK